MGQVLPVIAIVAKIGGAIAAAKSVYDIVRGPPKLSALPKRVFDSRQQSIEDTFRTGLSAYLKRLESHAPTFVGSNRDQLTEGYRVRTSTRLEGKTSPAQSGPPVQSNIDANRTRVDPYQDVP